jgi:hypothetical protein
MDLPLLLPPPKATLRRTLRRWLPSACLGIFVVGLFIQLCWPVSDLEKSLRRVQRWPQFPPSHFLLARNLSQNGYNALAQQEASQGKHQLDRLTFFLVGYLFQNDWQKTQAVVYQKSILETKLTEISQLLAAYPYSWQLLTQQAIWQYQLFQDDKALKSVETVQWLNPGDKTVEAVANLVGGQ